MLDRSNPEHKRQSTVTSILFNDYSLRYTNEVGYWALDMVAVPEANWLYVISAGDPFKKESGKLTRISAEQPTMVESVEIGIEPKRMVIGRERKGYITNFGDNKISVIDVFGEGIEVMKEIVLEGAAPFDIAIHPKKPEAFVSENKLGTVAVINTKEDAVIKKIPVGNNPSGIAFSADGTLAFVVNSKDKTVSEINAETLKVVGNPIVLDGAKYPVDIYISGKHGIVTDGEKSHIIEIATK